MQYENSTKDFFNQQKYIECLLWAMVKKLVTKTDKVCTCMKLTFKLGRRKVKKKINFKFCCKIYDKSIKNDTMNRNLILKQKLDKKAVWRKQGVKGTMIAFSSQSLQGSTTESCLSQGIPFSRWFHFLWQTKIGVWRPSHLAQCKTTLMGEYSLISGAPQ